MDKYIKDLINFRKFFYRMNKPSLIKKCNRLIKHLEIEKKKEILIDFRKDDGAYITIGNIETGEIYDSYNFTKEDIEKYKKKYHKK